MLAVDTDESRIALTRFSRFTYFANLWCGRAAIPLFLN